MSKVILYCRVSSDEQREGTSLDVQQERLQRYCEQHDYKVVGIYREDESAKTFEKRPQMQKIMKYIKTHKREVDKLLFLRWDRYSRDLTSAMENIKILRNMGVEPNAIESIVDFTNEMWPLQIGIQIGMAQGDNIKRAKATMDGIRGTLKKGKWPNKAPRGYKNVVYSKHDKRVEIVEQEAKIIREAFLQVANGVKSPTYIRRQICPRIPETSFFEMLRNPFYMGMVRIPKYKDEPEQIVKGQHEGIIDEVTYNKVQDILDGKKRSTPKLTKAINPDLYLRKFLICPICGHSLTGAVSRGNGGQYTYYNCCDNAKHIRKRAEDVNEGFARFLDNLKPNDVVLDLYEEILNDVRGEEQKERDKNVLQLNKQIQLLESRLGIIDDKFIDGDIDGDDYLRMKNRVCDEMKSLEKQRETLSALNREDIKPKLRYAINLIANLGDFFRYGRVEDKIMLLGSMFPEKIEYDGEKYRTQKYNKVLDLIYQETKSLRGEGIKKS